MNNFISIANPQRELSKIPKFYEDFNKQLKSGVFVGGKNLDLLEKSLANFLKVNYCSTLNSGTDALILSLIALDIGPGDEVIVPSFTYFATVGAVLQVNATPVFADIEKDSFCISLNTIKKLVTKKTKCIIPVHLYGYDSYEDRQSKRITLSKSPEFKAYIGKVKDLIVDMKNQLMTPATFSKIK